MEPERLQSLETIGPYRLLRRIGAGGMGEVFLAYDERLDRRVAIKRIRPETGDRIERRRRFRREARLAARLSHPAIVQVHDILYEGGLDHIVMEYVEGKTLRDMADRGPLEVRQVLELARELADGLDAAHRQGIVHRDLKTENVLVTPFGQPKITDFGIAKRFLSEGDEESLTDDGTVIGTCRSMSPEQARGEPVDHRTDLFAFGVLLHELLTGISPFAAENRLATLNRVIHLRQRPVRELEPAVPEELSHLVDRLLAKDARLRPQSAGQVHRELRQLLLITADLRGETLVEISSLKGPGDLPTVADGVLPAVLASPPAQIPDLPEDEIPEPGPLPPGSHIPLSRNPLFIGRGDDLRALARSLKAAGIAAATGLGGIGKTQLASEFVHRYGRFFAGGVFWMSFAEESAVTAEVVSSGRSLGLHPDYDNLPREQQLRLVKEVWHSPLPRLLVFDNCEDPALLDRWRPRHGGSRILVTSRRSQWDEALGIQTLALEILKRSESLKLLLGFRKDLAAETPVLNEIAEELGDLPLALHLAGSFLARYRHAPFGQPAAYLNELRRGPLLNHASLQGKGSEISPTGHERHVSRTFELGYERLNPEDPVDALALELLARAACFAPGEPIPRLLLCRTTGRCADDPGLVLEFEEALYRVVSLGLLQTGSEGTVVMHRLVSVFSWQAGFMEGDDPLASVEEVLLEEARRFNHAGYPAPLLALQSHWIFVTDGAREREDERAADLCVNLGFFLVVMEDFSRALPYCERAAAIRERISGWEHPDTALNMGLLLNCRRDPSGARVYYEKALAILDEDTEHPQVTRCLNNLGYLLSRQGDQSGAREYLERALIISTKLLGAESPEAALSLDNLGTLLFGQGDYSGARQHYEQALAIREKILGPQHPETALSLNNLGSLLNSQGDCSGGRAYCERALAIFSARLGTDHPWTQITKMTLSACMSSPKPLPEDVLAALSRGEAVEALRCLRVATGSGAQDAIARVAEAGG